MDVLSIAIRSVHNFCPCQFTDITKAKSDKARQEESLFDLFVGAWCFHQCAYFIDGKELSFFRGRLELFSLIQLFHWIARNESVTHGFVERTIEHCLVMMSTTRANSSAFLFLGNTMGSGTEVVEEATTEVCINLIETNVI